MNQTHRLLIPTVILPLLLACLQGSALSAAPGGAAQSTPQPFNPALTVPSPNNPEFPRRVPGQALSPEVKLEPPEQQKPAVPQGESRLYVSHFRIEGITLLTPQEVAVITGPVENKIITLTQLGQVANALMDTYRKKGYVTAMAYIPTQDIVNGVVFIRVVEGKIGRIAISKNRFFRARVIAQDFPEKPGTLFNIKTLETDLNRMNQSDKYQVEVALSPGEHLGETDVRLDVAEKQPWQISGTWDDQGRPFIGQLRWGAQLANSNLTGVGDQFWGSWNGSEGNQIASGNYTLPLNRYGTSLNTSMSYSHVNIRLNESNPPDITGNYYSYGLMLKQPLNPSKSFTVDSGLSIIRNNVFFDTLKTSQDDIRALQTGLTFNKPDRMGFTVARLQSTVAPLWLGANDKFWKEEFFLTRTLNLPWNQALMWRTYGQLTPDALPAAQEMQVGGVSSVRGYTEGLLLGDRGYTSTLEESFPLPGLSKLSPWLNERLRGAVFFDIGQVWLDSANDKFIKGISNGRQHTLLMGAGFGFRMQLTRFLQGFVDFGFGLVDRSQIEPLQNQPACRIHFGLRTDLLPDTLKYWGNKTILLPPAAFPAARAALK